MIDRIAKLLNKAERAATPEEAQAYFEKAQSLATAHSISLAKARLATSDIKVAPINKRIHVGAPRRHANRHLVNLMSAIARANDLKLDIAHNSTYVIVYGFPTDIAATELLWTQISTQMVRHGETFLATDVWRADQRLVQDGYATRLAPMTKQTARAQYYESFVATVGLRLRDARAKEVAEQKRREAARAAEHGSARSGHPSDAGGSTEVALVAKTSAVDEYYRRASRARGSWSGGSRVVGLSQAATDAGRRDGRRVSLGDDQGIGGGRRGLPR